MLERIDMDVIHMRPKIGLISDQMFPIPPLPDGALTALLPDG